MHVGVTGWGEMGMPMPQPPEPDVVVVPHGIMCSVLQLEERRIWPPSLRPRDRLGKGAGSSLKALPGQQAMTATVS